MFTCSQFVQYVIPVELIEFFVGKLTIIATALSMG